MGVFEFTSTGLQHSYFNPFAWFFNDGFDVHVSSIDSSRFEIPEAVLGKPCNAGCVIEAESVTE